MPLQIAVQFILYWKKHRGKQAVCSCCCKTLPLGECFSTPDLPEIVGLWRKVHIFHSYDFLIHNHTTLYNRGKMAVALLSPSHPDRLQWNTRRYPTSSSHCTEKRFEVEENKTHGLPLDFFTSLICFTLSDCPGLACFMPHGTVVCW